MKWPTPWPTMLGPQGWFASLEAQHWLFGLGLCVGLGGTGLAALSQANALHEAQVAYEQKRMEWATVRDQLRRHEERWLARAHAQAHASPRLPEPILPPEPQAPLTTQAFLEVIHHHLALNGLRHAVVSEGTGGSLQTEFEAHTEAALALVMQVHQTEAASPSTRLARWSVRCSDLACNRPHWQLSWQMGGQMGGQMGEQRHVDANAPQSLSPAQAQAQTPTPTPTPREAMPSGQTLHNPLAATAWWQQRVDQAPMAKGASRKQWEKDQQATEQAQHQQSGPWQWLGWMGRREGKKALVQMGQESVAVQRGQALARQGQDPVIVEAMDAQGLRLRRWAFNEQGRWQPVRETVEWLKPQSE